MDTTQDLTTTPSHELRRELKEMPIEETFSWGAKNSRVHALHEELYRRYREKVVRRATRLTETGSAACQDCLWSSTAANYRATAAHHADHHGHYVITTVIRRSHHRQPTVG